MADVNLQLVREFFELNLFRVLTNWQQESSRQRPGDPAPQLFVENIASVPKEAAGAPFLLRPDDLSELDRAVVEVRAWHADRFYPSVIEANPVLWQFAQQANLDLARDLFHDEPFTTILVVSELPASTEQRAKALALLEEAGIGHVIEFPVVIQGLLEKISEAANYGSSQTLQTLRLLKRYRFVRNQQLEFPFLTEAPVAETPASSQPADDHPALETGDLLAETQPEPEPEDV